jgi:hypothetical protein
VTFVKDSPLVARVVPTASSEQGARPGGAGDIRAIYVHMAEGGGTASWLTRPDGNSSHYVVEYTGAIVQMVKETNWAGSINPRLLRMTNDAPYTYLGSRCIYGRAAAVGALGTAAANDPNRYGIAIEVEGFAATGPNARQRATLAKLVNDIRRRRGAKPALGHRDFQDYKKCPGHLIPWVDYGGHAVKAPYVAAPAPTPPTPEAPMIPQFLVPEVPTRVVLEEDPARPGNSKWIYTTSACTKDGKEISLSPIRPLALVGFASADVYMVAYEPSSPDADTTSKTYFVPVTDIARTEPIPPPAAPAPVPPDAVSCKPFTDPLTARITAIKAEEVAHGAKVAAL